MVSVSSCDLETQENLCQCFLVELWHTRKHVAKQMQNLSTFYFLQQDFRTDVLTQSMPHSHTANDSLYAFMGSMIHFSWLTAAVAICGGDAQ